MTWATFWQYAIYSALALYFTLAVVIAIGGAFDVRKMFKRLGAMLESQAVDCPVCAARELAAKEHESDDSSGA